MRDLMEEVERADQVGLDVFGVGFAKDPKIEPLDILAAKRPALAAAH